ncbi:hypothetical protein KGA66_12735 [Actinocrinis puniceicyclus]|uniref:Uncharacterized protein n=1 Tax=Actinocrinis puniceicyclus TaxID=977794 RepID=A0A8J7WKE3_9ACTN|nr:hypothetical protein [Actinocrinis puniceicyclus]MBS2963916.1 hypothetical protein [Actinocrinis puniceicyclus]
MTERFPEQRNHSAQRRADAPQVPANAPSVEPNTVLPDNSTRNDAHVEDESLDAVLETTVFDESFVAAARVREPSAEDRALLARQIRAARLAELPSRRWGVRPSHHLAALRLPAVAAAVSALAAVALLLALLR